MFYKPFWMRKNQGQLFGGQGWAAADPWLFLTVFRPPLAPQFLIYKIEEK